MAMIGDVRKAYELAAKLKQDQVRIPAAVALLLLVDGLEHYMGCGGEWTYAKLRNDAKGLASNFAIHDDKGSIRCAVTIHIATDEAMQLEWVGRSLWPDPAFPGDESWLFEFEVLGVKKQLRLSDREGTAQFFEDVSNAIVRAAIKRARG